MVRIKIIEKLDKKFIEGSSLKFLKLLPIESMKDVNDWMEDCCASLYYKVNNRCLVFTNNDELTSLPMEISPFYSTIDRDEMYKFFTCYEKRLEDFSKNEYKEFANHLMSDSFKVENNGDLPTSDKRLSSYISYVSKWQFTNRREFIVVDLKNFDYDAFLDIDILSLWREVFFNFKHKNHAVSSNL